MPNQKGEKVYMVHFSLLQELWHIDSDVTREEALREISTHAGSATKEQVAQRLYGGFHCDEGGYHIFHAAGSYSYTSSSQQDITPEERASYWEELLQVNKGQVLHPGTLFAEDMPVATHDE